MSVNERLLHCYVGRREVAPAEPELRTLRHKSSGEAEVARAIRKQAYDRCAPVHRLAIVLDAVSRHWTLPRRAPPQGVHGQHVERSCVRQQRSGWRDRRKIGHPARPLRRGWSLRKTEAATRVIRETIGGSILIAAGI